MKILKKDISKCRGKINISWLHIHERPAEVQLVFAKIIPIRAELMFRSNSIEYECISNEFDELEEFQGMPNYDVILDHGTVIFKRM